jgi:hypothetical protein
MLGFLSFSGNGQVKKAPNVVFVLTDEWRAQDVGYNGNKDVLTPNLDKLAQKAVNFTNTIATTPVCCPYRGSLLTGQYPLTHGVFVNDVLLNPEANTLGKSFKAAPVTKPPILVNGIWMATVGILSSLSSAGKVLNTGKYWNVPMITTTHGTGATTIKRLNGRATMPMPRLSMRRITLRQARKRKSLFL